MGSLRVKIKLTVTVSPVTVRSVGHDMQDPATKDGSLSINYGLYKYGGGGGGTPHMKGVGTLIGNFEWNP